jgi:serine/threonine protein kinase
LNRQLRTSTIRALEIRRLGKYEIIGTLGQGAMGEVFRAHDPVLSRDVAIKTLPAALRGDDELLARVLREARSVATLHHPNIISVYDFGVGEGRIYLAMELLEGHDLKEVIGRKAPLTLEDKIDIMEQITEGLAFAHARGVVHTDLKPANLHIQPNGQIKIADFGLAKLSSSDMTRAGMIMGTPNYMSPEQVRGEKADARSDVFSLGAVFYELLTNRKPFDASSLHAIFFQVMQSEPEPLRNLVADCPPILAQLVDKALAKDAARRYQDAGELREALKAVRESLAPVVISAPPLAPAEPPPKATPSNRVFDQDVQFTLYRPEAMAPDRWYTMLAFAHLSQRRPDASPEEPDPIKEVKRRAEKLLDDASAYRQQTDDSAQPVPREGEVTFRPYATGIEFNPSSRTFRWTESVHHEEFRLRVRPGVSDGMARGRLTVLLGGSIILAEFNLSMTVDSRGSTHATSPVREEVRPYRKLFASYSHRDRAVVEEYSGYARAVGDRYLRDVADLRSGERWQPALEDLIQRADLFQLFWSWNSLESPMVRREWQFALSLGKSRFVRPVYWEEPLPCRGDLPPQSLRELHFERIFPRSEARPTAVPLPSPTLGTPAAAQPAPSWESRAGRPIWAVAVVVLAAVLALLFRFCAIERRPRASSDRLSWPPSWAASESCPGESPGCRDWMSAMARCAARCRRASWTRLSAARKGITAAPEPTRPSASATATSTSGGPSSSDWIRAGSAKAPALAARARAAAAPSARFSAASTRCRKAMASGPPRWPRDSMQISATASRPVRRDRSQRACSRAVES